MTMFSFVQMAVAIGLTSLPTTLAHNALSFPLRMYGSATEGPISSSNYPCAVPQGQLSNVIAQSPISATLTAGQSFTAQFSSQTFHGGGSCQFSLSFDNGASFQVIQTNDGGCPVESGLNVTLPANIPSHSGALLAWTWIPRLSGQPEYYMSCSKVDVVGTSKGDLSTLPSMFVAIINSCKVDFSLGTLNLRIPNPGSNLVVDPSLSSLPEGYGLQASTCSDWLTSKASGQTSVLSAISPPPVSTLSSGQGTTGGMPNALWSKCGGQGWTGSIECGVGAYCKAWDQWYSQCIPGSAPAVNSVASTTIGEPSSSVPLPIPNTTSAQDPMTNMQNGPLSTQTSSVPLTSATVSSAPFVSSSITNNIPTSSSSTISPSPATSTSSSLTTISSAPPTSSVTSSTSSSSYTSTTITSSGCPNLSSQTWCNDLVNACAKSGSGNLFAQKTCLAAAICVGDASQLLSAVACRGGANLKSNAITLDYRAVYAPFVGNCAWLFGGCSASQQNFIDLIYSAIAASGSNNYPSNPATLVSTYWAPIAKWTGFGSSLSIPFNNLQDWLRFYTSPTKPTNSVPKDCKRDQLVVAKCMASFQVCVANYQNALFSFQPVVFGCQQPFLDCTAC